MGRIDIRACLQQRRNQLCPVKVDGGPEQAVVFLRRFTPACPLR